MPDPSDLPASAPDIPAQPAAVPDPSVGLDLTGVHPHALDPHQRVAVELPCRQCGYNLRTMHAGANCPECGTAVHWSLVGNLLRFADADWLDTLTRGALWSLMVLVGSFAFGMLVGGVMEATGSTDSIAYLLISVVAGIVFTVVYWLATICITQPEPGTEHEPGTLRKWARGLMLLSIAFGVLGVVGEVVDFFVADLLTTQATIPTPVFSTPGGPTGPAIPGQPAAVPINYQVQTTLGNIWLGIQGFFQLLGLIGVFCLALYLRRLALRAPAPGLAKQTLILFWSWIGVIVLGLLGTLVMFEIMSSSGFGGAGLGVGVAVLGCGLGLLVLGLGIWAIVVHVLYYNLFKKHAGYARDALTRSPPHLAPGQ